MSCHFDMHCNSKSHMILTTSGIIVSMQKPEHIYKQITDESLLIKTIARNIIPHKWELGLEMQQFGILSVIIFQSNTILSCFCLTFTILV